MNFIKKERLYRYKKYRPLKKCMNIMRAIVLFLIVGTIQSFAVTSYSQSTKLTLKVEQSTVAEVLSMVEKQSQFYFTYNYNQIDASRKVSINVKDKMITDILKDLFPDGDVGYEIKDKHIVLYKVERKDLPGIQQQNPQKKRITGTITDESGLPIIGANVVEKGTTNGIITDLDGKVSLEVAPNAILQISYVGYLSQDISVANRQNFNIVLKEDFKQLEEIVVVGYGTTKRSDLTGAISSVSASQIQKVPVTNVGQAMQGRMSGVHVVNNDGSPGAGVQVQIRGIGSFGDNSPLYVIDGYPGGSTSNLNPSDILTIDVLKDASAAAIYGNRAANGVVIITTKRGNKDGVRIAFDATSSVQLKPQTYDVLNTQEFAKLATAVASKEGSPVLAEWTNPESLRTIDWQDLMYRSGLKQNYNLSIRGGSDKSQSAVSLGMIDQKGVVEFSNYKRYNISFTQDYVPYKWMKSSTTARYSYTDEKSPFGSGQGGIGRLAKLIPTMTGNPLTDLPDDGNGNYGYYSKTENAVRDNENVYARNKLNDQKNIGHNLTASSALEIYPMDGLTLKTNFGISYGASSGYNFNPLDDRVPTTRKATYSQYATNSFEYLWENTANYTKTFGLHSVEALAGVSIQENTARNMYSDGEGVISDGLRNIASMQTLNSSGYQQTWSLASYFGRATYKFADKYIITGTVRRDGSSRFAKGNQWGTFPSISAAWRIKEEGFLENVDLLSNLKLRVSYGEAGNQNIGLFQYQSSYTTGSRTSNKGYVFGQDKTYVDGMVQAFLPNPNLKWETSKQTDIGLDFGFLDNKLTFVADYYVKKSSDFLLNTKMPAQTGFLEATRNVGSVKNSGFELLLNYRDNSKDFKYEVSVNFTTVKNKIEKLAPGMNAVANLQNLNFPTTGNTPWAVFSMSEVGGSIGDFYGFKTDGIIQTQAEIDALNANARTQANDPSVWYNTSKTAPGDRKFVDTNDDGRITDADRVVIGSPIPKFYGGINFNGEYKNFDFNIFFNYSYGNDILSFVKRNLYSLNGEGSIGLQNVSKEFYDNYWRGEGSTNKYTRAVWSDVGGNSRVSDAFVEDGSYLRLKNIEVGYTIPNALSRKINGAKLRVFGSVQNLFTITGYSGMDPEIGQSMGSNGIAGGVTASGIDVGIYPYSKFFSLGINIQF
ncbi:TonB-dependent receptor [Parabacteroides sp. Marseille-P3160]|uniref:SusC/RagA family TonB-linked outer membrane protein n=1 Tax=Parabacteroides sp. Marseille-P3160 TaxID=1917887 RepID=UPI0009BACB13|nr:TonB-dependent receptor [Parabacteroides sp. Marseille-P3160]